MKSLPSPPISTSSPLLPRIVSLPSPPSTVSLTTPAGSVDALMLSLPPSALTTSESLEPSEPLTATTVCRPVTVKLDLAPVTLTASALLVPLTMTVSACPSPVPLP